MVIYFCECEDQSGILSALDDADWHLGLVDLHDPTSLSLKEH